jgi:hypothetical protein
MKFLLKLHSALNFGAKFSRLKQIVRERNQSMVLEISNFYCMSQTLPKATTRTYLHWLSPWAFHLTPTLKWFIFGLFPKSLAFP